MKREYMENYYLYLNWTHDYVGIHKGTCNICKNGKGIQNKTSAKHGIWIGPLKDLKDAKFVASKLKKRTITECSRCL